MLVIKSDEGKFVEGKVIMKKDNSGKVGFLTIQLVMAKGTDKEFTKIENYFLENPSDNTEELFKTLEMGDLVILNTSLDILT